ncbi:MAG: hypothetical protein EPO42_13265 [Gallionellaceae bacterium]|nr:MAG: hypothetical protein EPO42_13265 [Gallionellaceae bacterium]
MSFAQSGSPAAILAAQNAAASAAASAASLAAAVVQGRFVSAPVALSAAVNAVSTFAHGLGAMPQFCKVKLVCAVADAGYSVGDEIDLSGYVDGGFMTVTVSATAVSVRVALSGSQVRVTNLATPTVTSTLLNTSWTLIVKAYK